MIKNLASFLITTKFFVFITYMIIEHDNLNYVLLTLQVSLNSIISYRHIPQTSNRETNALNANLQLLNVFLDIKIVLFLFIDKNITDN